MNRLVRGSIMVVTAALAWACSTNLGENGDQTDHLVASPSVLLVNNTDSQTVDVEALNPQGQQLAASFSISSPGTGIVVRQDTSFLPISGGHVTTRARFVVRATSTTTFANTSFTVSANGHTITVPVKIVPANLDIVLSNPAPVLGDTVTLTAPIGLHFTSATTIVFGTGVTALTALITGLNADSTQISFLLPPNINTQVATVSNVIVDYLPGQLFTIATTGTASTPTVDSLQATINDATPNIGDTLTMTLAAPYKLITGTVVSLGGKPVIEISRSADSSSLTFVPYPGASGVTAFTVSGLAPQPLPNLPTTATVDLPTNFPGTASVATAPTIVMPATGLSEMFVDAGVFSAGEDICDNTLGGPCRIYKFTLAAPQTLSFSVTWQGTTDLGLYFSSTGTNLVVTTGCDSKGATVTGQPETCTGNFPAGTFYMVNDSFAPFYAAPNNVDPSFVKIVITSP
ncbi:MAG: hypothetical protein ABI836_00985 [Gemmatimonadota bacterium]